MNTQHQKKKKLSVDLRPGNWEPLKQFCDVNDCTTSDVINCLINTFIPTNSSVHNEIAEYAFSQYQAKLINSEMASTFEKDRLLKEAKAYRAISEFYNFQPDLHTIDNGMKKTYLSNGYVTYPKDWIVLDGIFGAADNCMYAGVVESRNSIKYGIPHFIFFSNKKYQNEYTDEMEQAIYNACAKVYPRFKELFNMQQECPSRSSESYEQDLLAWNEAPHFALFHIVEKDDPLYWSSNPDYNPPAGAMIIRE